MGMTCIKLNSDSFCTIIPNLIREVMPCGVLPFIQSPSEFYPIYMYLIDISCDDLYAFMMDSEFYCRMFMNMLCN